MWSLPIHGLDPEEIPLPVEKYLPVKHDFLTFLLLQPKMPPEMLFPDDRALLEKQKVEAEGLQQEGRTERSHTYSHLSVSKNRDTALNPSL